MLWGRAISLLLLVPGLDEVPGFDLTRSFFFFEPVWPFELYFFQTVWSSLICYSSRSTIFQAHGNWSSPRSWPHVLKCRQSGFGLHWNSLKDSLNICRFPANEAHFQLANQNLKGFRTKVWGFNFNGCDQLPIRITSSVSYFSHCAALICSTWAIEDMPQSYPPKDSSCRNYILSRTPSLACGSCSKRKRLPLDVAVVQ